MTKLHPLLQRQLKKVGLNFNDASGALATLLPLVEQAYKDFDSERKLLEHAMDVSSKEMVLVNRRYLQTAEEAKATARFRTDFLANMSHEIRTPLNGILGLVEILLEGTRNQEALDTLDLIKKSGRGLLAVINDVLDLSKIEAGKMSINMSSNNLFEVLDEIRQMFAAAAYAKQISLILEIGANVPKFVMVDDARLRQILSNLIANAIKFTAEGGGVVIFLDLEKSQDGSPFLHFAVVDSGIGIEASKTANLFVPFNQADSSVTRRYGGTGLGLAICQRLLQIMGGKIWFVTREDVGSAFHFSLPAIDVERVVPETGTEETSSDEMIPYKQLSILLAEDNQINQKVAKHALQRLGFNVEVVNNGVEAVEAFRDKPFDMIFMDCQMPEMSGFEATLQIRQLPKGAMVPIVALTAMAMEGDKQKCLASGMNAYIAKPFSKSDLERIIRELLS